MKGNVCCGMGFSTSGILAVAFSVTSQQEIRPVDQDENSCAEIKRKSAGWLWQAFPGDSFWHNPGQAVCSKRSGYPALLRKRQAQEPKSFVILWHEVFYVSKVYFMHFITPLSSWMLLTQWTGKGFTGIGSTSVVIISSCLVITWVAVILLPGKWTHVCLCVFARYPKKWDAAFWPCIHHAASQTAGSLSRRMMYNGADLGDVWEKHVSRWWWDACCLLTAWSNCLQSRSEKVDPGQLWDQNKL